MPMSAQGLLINRTVTADTGRPRAFLFYKAASLCPYLRPQRASSQHTVNGSPQCDWVARAKQEPGFSMANQLTVPAHIGRDKHAP